MKLTGLGHLTSHGILAREHAVGRRTAALYLGLLGASLPPVLRRSCCMQAPKGATQSAGVVVEQSASCLYVKVRT